MSASLAAPRRITGRVAAITILLAALAAPFASATAPEAISASIAGESASRDAAVDPALVEALREGPADAIVQVEPAARSAAHEAITSSGGTLGVDLGIVDGFAATLTADGLEALRGIAGVLSVTLDGEVTLSHTPPLGESNGDYRYDEVVGAHDLHHQGITGAGVGIAIIDTGVSPGKDLAGRVVGGVDISGGNNPTKDEYGHGTFIAGIAAGDGTASNGKFAGIAPGAHIVPVKIAGANGAANVSHVLAAIEWTVGHRDTYDIGVLNLSLGTDSTQSRFLSPMNYAVERAWDSGIVVVVSGGNRGAEGPGRIPKPADDPLVITVGATDANGTKPTGDDTIAPYSSRGPSIADGVVKPDIVAPGSHLVAPKAVGSTVDVENPSAHIRSDYMRASGTSFAAGVTSGAVALLREAHPDWTPDQIKGAITSSATPGPVGDRNVDGHGILNVAGAAALLNPPLANQDVVRSTGLGTLAGDRGSVQTGIVLDPILGTVLQLSSEITAQNVLWNGLQYTTSEWDGSHWYGSHWYGSHWYGSHWYGSHWYGSHWYGSHWYGSHWYTASWS